MKTTATIQVSILDGKDYPPEAIEAWRMHVESIVHGEAGKRLLRALQHVVPAELRWTIQQSPRPQGTKQPTHREIAAAHAKQKAETEAYFEARRQLRLAQAQAREDAAARLRSQGIAHPTPMQVVDELSRKPAPVSAEHRANQTTRATTSTDVAVRQILRKKEADGDDT